MSDSRTTIQVTDVTCDSAGSYCTEASQVGFLPGRWPLHLRLEGRGQSFDLELVSLMKSRDGEVLGARYQSAACTIRLIIFND